MDHPPVLLAPLPSYETRFKAGDKAALFDAVAHCATWQLPMPEWTRHALMEASTARARLEYNDLGRRIWRLDAKSGAAPEEGAVRKD